MSSSIFNLRKAALFLSFVLANIISRNQSLLQVCSYHPHRLVVTPSFSFIASRNLNFHKNHIASYIGTFLGMASTGYDPGKALSRIEGDAHVETVLFVECGFGNDSHGQSATKAAIRACRNAIEFNSIPSVSRLVPNGYEGLKLDVLLAVPARYKNSLDLSQVQEVFPYGSIHFQIQNGGMIAPSGIAIEKLGDTSEDMVVVCAAVTVGY